MIDGGLIDSWRSRLESLLLQEEVYAQEFSRNRREQAGLIDFSIGFKLIQCRLDIALHGVVAFTDRMRQSAEFEKLYTTCSRAAREAVELFDDLNIAAESANERLDTFPEYGAVRDTIEALLLRGGGSYFEEETTRFLIEKRLVDIVTDAIEKYAPPDDEYEPLVRLDAIGPALKRFVARVLPYSSATEKQRPPYGLDESTEEHSDKVIMPLSQAISFYENEVIPGLVEDNDSAALANVRRTIEELKQIQVRPRSRPLITPVGYYTEGLTKFNAQGEPLIPISLEATYLTGTNLDRIMELVRDEVTRKIAGTGIHRHLDAELARLKSIESGVEGSKMFPSLKLDTARWFVRLKHRYPRLNILSDRDGFSLLLDTARDKSRRVLKRSVRRELISHPGHRTRPGDTTLMQN